MIRNVSDTFLVLSLLLSGCGVPAVLREAKDVAHPSVAGELTLRVPEGEPVVWRPDVCFSGEHEQFFGFILASNGLGSSGSPVVLRAVVDPLDGPGLRIAGLEGRGGLVVRPSVCERLELVVKPTGWRVNDIRDLTGSLEVRCSTAEGASVEGTVEVRHCH